MNRMAERNAYCGDCGQQPTESGECPVCKKRILNPEPRKELSGLRLPKANTPRRLLGSGIEFIVYSMGLSVVAAADTATFGAFGLLALVIVGLIVIRDFNAGKLSISKRVSHMRVVDFQTGITASNVQAVLRNCYYLGLPFAAAFLPLVDFVSTPLFLMFIALDIMMILASGKGRRLGDFLAGTQVVEAEV